MKKGFVWLVVSSLMVLSLVLASCAPKVTETPKVTEEKKVVTEEKKVVTQEKKVVTEEKKAVLPYQKDVPQYGGTISIAEAADADSVHQATTSGRSTTDETLRFVTDLVAGWDRTRGPAGTGEWAGLTRWFQSLDMMVGLLAERFEIIQPDTIIFHVRKGVRWQDKPPVNGREMTADDFVFTLRRQFGTVGVMQNLSYPFLSDMKNVANSIYIAPDDPWAVVIKTLPGQLAYVYETTADHISIDPVEYDKYPRGVPPSWKEVVGTGPFFWADRVMGSSMTYERNPNHWQKDPLYPQNQLPYADTIKQFIIPDLSTRMAALRTGKIDQLFELENEDAESLMKTNPQLLWVKSLIGASMMYMRHDVKPFDNMKVRRAMMMAINYPEIVKDYYGGEAVAYYWPAFPIPEHAGYYVPLEKLGLSSDGFDTKKLYEYHPDEAMKLLDAAGLPGPNRFTTSIIVNSALEEDIDILSVVKNYWAKVGVTLNIEVKEPTVFRSIGSSRSYTQGYMGTMTGVEPLKWTRTRAGTAQNNAIINEPLVEATADAVIVNYFNTAERERIVREATPELVSKALLIFLPAPYVYTMWQPWLKGYHGERYGAGYADPNNFPRYTWIDQSLKQEMTGRK